MRIITGLLGHSRIMIVMGYLLLVLVATACGASAPPGTKAENSTLEGSDTSAPASGTSVLGAQILVASLEQTPSIRPIASGAMGFWSPR